VGSLAQLNAAYSFQQIVLTSANRPIRPQVVQDGHMALRRNISTCVFIRWRTRTYVPHTHVGTTSANDESRDENGGNISLKAKQQRFLIIILLLCAATAEAVRVVPFNPRRGNTHHTPRASDPLYGSRERRLSGSVHGTGGRWSTPPTGFAFPRHEPTGNRTRRETGTVPNICSSVKSRVRYTRDTEPHHKWQSGKATFERRAGDCEDFAACVKELCDEKGIRSDIYVFAATSLGKGHAVTIGSSDGGLWMSSNGSYTRIESLEDAKNRIATSLGWTGHDVTYRIAKPPAR
jgi:predicted transglutaminase-like cysteine proteinase